jgi:preprotein translocase subunit YajC
MSDDVLTVEISPKVRVKISRGSIAGVARKAEAQVNKE